MNLECFDELEQKLRNYCDNNQIKYTISKEYFDMIQKKVVKTTDMHHYEFSDTLEIDVFYNDFPEGREKYFVKGPFISEVDIDHNDVIESKNQILINQILEVKKLMEQFNSAKKELKEFLIITKQTIETLHSTQDNLNCSFDKLQNNVKNLQI